MQYDFSYVYHIVRFPAESKKWQGCSVVKGALLGALVLFAMAPLVVAWFMGYRQGQYAAPIGVAASILMAVYLGGVVLIWTVLLPTAVAIVIIGG